MLWQSSQEPEEAAYLWHWWADAAQARPQGAFGATTLSWTDWQAWSAMRARTLQPFELDALLAIDHTYTRTVHDLI